MKKIELMSRHEAEDAANKMCQDCPECEYVVYGWQRKQSKNPVFQSPIAMTDSQVNNMRNQYKDVFAIRNPYHKENIMEANKEKKLYRYEGALLDMSLDKPFAYTNKAYYVQAYSPKQAILLLKKEIAKDMNMDVDDFHLTQLNLYEVPDVEEEEEFYEVDFNTCPLCGHKLNDGGACPICDDGEEEYDDFNESNSVCKSLNELNKKTEAFSYDEMTPKFDISLLDNWISRLNEYEKSKGYSFEKIYDYTIGKKYIKVFFSYGNTGRSVFAFVDEDGNIYKPAGWNNPAKGVRARIDNNPPLDGGDLYSKKYW